MSSESEDASEPSLKGTSEIRLYALEPKGNKLGVDGVHGPSDALPTTSVDSINSKGSINGYQERSNPSYAL